MSSRRGRGLSDGERIVISVLGVLAALSLAAQLGKGMWHRYGHWWPWAAAVAGVVVVLVAVGWWQEGVERDERLAVFRLSLDQIDVLSPTGFELAVRDLMNRDGIASRQVGQAGDQAADVIGRDGAGRVFVVQCKHTRTGSRVGARVMYEVNGTARPVHGADIAVVVTNGAFTRDATAFAGRHGIGLVDREALRAWAAEGVALQTLVGLRPARALSQKD